MTQVRMLKWAMLILLLGIIETGYGGMCDFLQNIDNSGSSHLTPFTCVKVFSGGNHTIALRSDGTLWAWGNNGFGLLGLGDTTNRMTPTQVGTTTDWTMIDCGYSHTLALKSDGTLWAWGWNNDAQLGIVDDRTERLLPTKIGADTDWKDISGGTQSSLGLKTDGTIWAWGYNVRLGVNISDTYIPPTKIGTDTDWAKIEIGNQQRFGIKTNGTLWAWGADTNGQLGLGGGGGLYESPTKVGTDTDWAMIQSEGVQTFAIKTDGTLWACGSNGGGELGLGDTTERLTLTPVGLATNWQLVANSGNEGHALAIKTDGTLWAWGNNQSGQLGDGTTTSGLTITYRSSPAQVGALTTWQQVACGMGYTLAVQADATLWAWGYNVYGQLGDGTTTQRTSPVQIFK